MIQQQFRFGNSLDERFRAVHELNPTIYRMFKYFTFEAIKAGKKHLSADLIVHRIRWYTGIEMKGDTYKINNNYISRYARKFMEEFPEYNGFFRTRQLKT